MAEQQKQPFDPQKPSMTRSGHDVVFSVFKNKIMGVVKIDSEDGVFCEWSMNGKKNTLYPRKRNETHELDLVNYNE